MVSPLPVPILGGIFAVNDVDEVTDESALVECRVIGAQKVLSKSR